MKKTYRIHFWHGIKKDSRCFEKIQEICKLVDPGSEGEDAVYHFTGTLDEFDSLYVGNFILLNIGQAGGFPVICVTHYHNFASR